MGLFTNIPILLGRGQDQTPSIHTDHITCFDMAHPGEHFHGLCMIHPVLLTFYNCVSKCWDRSLSACTKQKLEELEVQARGMMFITTDITLYLSLENMGYIYIRKYI